MDICIPAFGVIVIVLLLGVVLARRYGHHLAVAALGGIVLASLAAASVGFVLLRKGLDGGIDPGDGWHKVTSLGRQVTELRYEPEEGLLVTTDDGETSLFRADPFCLPDGELAQLAANYVETTDKPYVTLPQPPRPFKQQISFNLSYAVSTTGLGASSFGIDENGELWCTERFYQAGTGGAETANSVISYIVIMIFAGSFVVTIVPVAAALEIHRRRNAHQTCESR